MWKWLPFSHHLSCSKVKNVLLCMLLHSMDIFLEVFTPRKMFVHREGDAKKKSSKCTTALLLVLCDFSRPKGIESVTWKSDSYGKTRALKNNTKRSCIMPRKLTFHVAFFCILNEIWESLIWSFRLSNFGLHLHTGCRRRRKVCTIEYAKYNKNCYHNIFHWHFKEHVH